MRLYYKRLDNLISFYNKSIIFKNFSKSFDTAPCRKLLPIAEKMGVNTKIGSQIIIRWLKEKLQWATLKGSHETRERFLVVFLKDH